MSKIRINSHELVRLEPIKIGFDMLIGYYHLLRYLSDQYQGKLIFEAGTYKGHGAAVLGMNKRNRVITCDVKAEETYLLTGMKNVEKKICSFNDISDDILLESVFMFIDTAHTGDQERIFYDKLKKIGYKGYTLWDDVNIFRKDWQSFDEDAKSGLIKKYEVPILHPDTNFGIIDFGDNIDLEI